MKRKTIIGIILIVLGILVLGVMFSSCTISGSVETLKIELKDKKDGNEVVMNWVHAYVEEYSGRIICLKDCMPELRDRRNSRLNFEATKKANKANPGELYIVSDNDEMKLYYIKDQNTNIKFHVKVFKQENYMTIEPEEESVNNFLFSY